MDSVNVELTQLIELIGLIYEGVTAGPLVKRHPASYGWNTFRCRNASCSRCYTCPRMAGTFFFMALHNNTSIPT